MIIKTKEQERKADEPTSIEKRPLSRTIFVGILIISGFSVFFSLALYQFRNSNHFEVSKRFVRNNETIRSEVGEILQITDANDDAMAERNKEINRRLKNGEGLANLDDTKKIDRSKVTSVRDSSETAYSINVTGSKKTIQVIVYMREHNYSDSEFGKHYTVRFAKYKDKTDETENLKEIPVGFVENYLLLFK